MPMNNRLLRPRQGGTPGRVEANDWAARVVANGGTVSASTLSAVRVFCDAIITAGIRDRFLRLSLFCGDDLSAALVPLYRGQSRTGTQFGNTTDTNANFVSTDYTETGTSGGLGTGATNTTKTLDTGLSPFAAGITEANSHLAFYSRQGNTTTGSVLAAGNSTGGQPLLQWFVNGVSGSVTQFFRSGGSTNSGLEGVAALRTGHMLAQRSASGGAMYRNGANLNLTSTTTNTTTFAAGTPPGIRVFARRFFTTGNTTDQYLATTLQSYSIGLPMTDAQALAYYNAMQAFQTALGRQL